MSLATGYPTSFAAPTGDPWFVADHGGEPVNDENFSRTSGQAVDEEEDFRALQVGNRRLLLRLSLEILSQKLVRGVFNIFQQYVEP